MSKPQFRPSPRPRAASGDEAAQQLTEVSRDLGFGRPSTDRAQHGASAQMDKRPFAQQRSATIKAIVDQALYDALRRAALDRRVTVQYLILEALAAKGFPVDLNIVPEDGRRAR